VAPARAVGAVGWLLVGLATSSRGVLLAAGGDVRIQADGDLANPLPGAFRVLSVVVIAGTLVSWTAWLAIQIPAYRHASGEYRQQLKWLYSGAGIFVVSLIFGVFIAQLVAGNAPGWGNQAVVGAVVILGTAALPVCMGVAVLKYRLYELNRVISRVVSYTLITALLGGLFAGLILLATHVLPVKGSGRGRGHAGHRGAVQPAAHASTACRRPPVQPGALRRRGSRDRVHRATAPDHRPGHVRGDLAGVVHEAFQPAHVSVWLPGTAPRNSVAKLDS
jgi:hypothetical protein